MVTIKITKAGKVTGAVSDLAAWLGLTSRRIQQLADDGKIKRDARGSYDMKAAILDYVKFLRAGEEASKDRKSEQSQRTRLVAAKADIAELESAERAGSLVNADAVRSQDFTLGLIMRNNLFSMADRIAPLVAAEAKAAECHRLITAEVINALEQIIANMEGAEIDEAELDITRRIAGEYLDAAEPTSV